LKTITIKPLQSFRISVEAEVISPDRFSPLSLEQIGSLPVWEGNCKRKLSELFQVEGDDGTAKPEETTIRLEGDFSAVKRVAEGMSAGTVEVLGDIGMHAGNSMKGGLLHIDGRADDWLGREMRGGRIEVTGDVGNYAGAGYRGEKCGMRGGEIDIRGRAGDYLGEHLCGGSIKVGGDCGDFPGAANQGGTISIGGSAYLPGAEMTKGTITVKGDARVLPSYQKTEMVVLEETSYQKYVGDLADNGKGELLVAAGEQSSS
jgi:formylmethanofuran dehydrogenase subunit C